jgi:purine nucleoside phosphorylase
MQVSSPTLSVGIIGGGALASQWGLPQDTIRCGTSYGEPSSAVVQMRLNPHVTVYALLRHGEQHALGRPLGAVRHGDDGALR